MNPEPIPSTSSPEPGTLFATANSTLLAPYALDMHALQSVLGSIMTHRVDYADLYFQYSRAESWGLEEGQVKSGSFSIDQGVGVRAVSGEKTAFAYSDDISLPRSRASRGRRWRMASVDSDWAMPLTSVTWLKLP